MYRIIDIHTSFGKRVDDDHLFSADTLSSELDDHNVAAALTYSAEAVDYSPKAGNAKSLSLHARQKHLLPVAVINLKGSPGWENELSKATRKNFYAVKIFPVSHGYSIDSASFRTLAEKLDKTHMPLMVSSIDCPTGWELPSKIAELTKNYSFPVVLLDTFYANMAEVMYVLKKYRHVYAETNGLATINAIGIMAETVGYDRLLYGSAFPLRPIQKSLNQILDADIPEKQKAAILGENAVRLFGIQKQITADRPVWRSLKPVLFTEPVFDVHSHLGYWPLPCADEGYDPIPMLYRMERLGIAKSIVSSYESMRYDIQAGNEKIIKAITQHKKLLAYVELDPWHIDLSCREMDKYYKLPNVVGCEIELTHIPCPTSHPNILKLMREIAKRGKPVLFMPASQNDAAMERELALKFPSLQIIHAHGANPEWCEIVKDAPNLNIEYCYSRPSHHNLRAAIDILGCERVLFGSDQTLLNPAAELGLYYDAKMSATERKYVLYKNAERIFKCKIRC